MASRAMLLKVLEIVAEQLAESDTNPYEVEVEEPARSATGEIVDVNIPHLYGNIVKVRFILS